MNRVLRFGKSRRGWGQHEKEKEGATDEGADTDPTGSPSENIRERREGPHGFTRDAQAQQQHGTLRDSHGPAGHTATEASSGADSSGAVSTATVTIEQGGSTHYGHHKEPHTHHQVRMNIRSPPSCILT